MVRDASSVGRRRQAARDSSCMTARSSRLTPAMTACRPSSYAWDRLASLGPFRWANSACWYRIAKPSVAEVSAMAPESANYHQGVVRPLGASVHDTVGVALHVDSKVQV